MTLTPYYESADVTLYLGDCRDVMPSLAGVTAVVCDPPYGLTFMGRGWDRGVPGEEFWTLARACSKPGAPLLAFGGTRTFHRLTCAIEDAGWEIRDCLSWLHGSGFPKSLDLSKAIDKRNGDERPVVGSKRTNVGMQGGNFAARATTGDVAVTSAASAASAAWSGMGTALKPSHEPVVVARNPLELEVERRTILANLAELEARLCLCLSDALLVECASRSNRSVEQLLATARWGADDRTRIRAGLCAATDTSRCDAATASCLNTVRSWRSALAGHSDDSSTYTTATATSPTTDWRTLRFCLSVITPAHIIRAETIAPGSMLAASPAVAYFSAAVARLESTRTLSALAPAIELARTEHQEDLGLRPDWSPIVLAMAPLDGTFAENALQHGVAGINVDDARICWSGPEDAAAAAAVGFAQSRARGTAKQSVSIGKESRDGTNTYDPNVISGRWPANVALDEEAARLLDDQTGELQSGALTAAQQEHGGFAGAKSCYGRAARGGTTEYDANCGGASRFFYTAKADRESFNSHPTVKPLDLMRWLVRLVTMPSGTLILGPFAGSGTTLVAARAEHVRAIGIEREEKYAEIAAKRLAQGALNFDGAAA